MATGRIGVTPTLRTRWSDQPTAGTTSLSGLDDNSVALVYDVGYEAVYRNGVLLSRGNDYTATDGTTVTLVDATLAGDIIEIFANQLVPLTDAISKGQYTAKGALLSATAASTPGVLTVGTDGQVLTAASGQSTGLQWATPAAGGMTLLSTTALSGTSTVISSIDQTYKNLQIVLVNAVLSTSDILRVRVNATGLTMGAVSGGTAAQLNNGDVSDGSRNTFNYVFTIYDYTTSVVHNMFYAGDAGTTSMFGGGRTGSSAAVTAMTFTTNAGTPTFSSGTVQIYGVK